MAKFGSCIRARARVHLTEAHARVRTEVFLRSSWGTVVKLIAVRITTLVDQKHGATTCRVRCCDVSRLIGPAVGRRVNGSKKTPCGRRIGDRALSCIAVKARSLWKCSRKKSAASRGLNFHAYSPSPPANPEIAIYGMRDSHLSFLRDSWTRTFESLLSVRAQSTFLYEDRK